MKLKKYSFLVINIILAILNAHREGVFSKKRTTLHAYFKAITNIIQYFVHSYEDGYPYEGFLYTDTYGLNIWIVRSVTKDFFFIEDA